MKEYRYPGAQPFSIKNKDIFFGREKDISDLFDLISLQKLVVLHSKSGLGKSSLLNAGIIPRIQKEGNYLPISIRFGACTSDTMISPIGTTQDRIKKEELNQSFLNKLIPKENSLWYHVKNRQYYSEQKTGFLLVFDQFEELFTYSPTSFKEFARQLAELLNKQIPRDFRKALEAQYQKEELTLTQKELDALHQPFDLKVIVAIRSDRMSSLDGLKIYLRNILRYCYKLDALSEYQAEEAILNPAFKKGEQFITPPFDYSDETLDAILDFLTKNHSQKIESFQLQILCQNIELKVIKNKLKEVNIADIGNIENIYKNYYDHQISRLDSDEEKLAARRLVEEGLIFEEEERRLSLYEGQIHKNFNVNDELLGKLVNSHLLRREPSMQGGYTYELSHDTLVTPVLKAKERRVKKEEKLTQEKEEEEKLEALKEAQEKANEEQQKAKRETALRIEAENNAKKARQVTRWAVIVTILALLATLTTAIFYVQRMEATKEKEKTQLEQFKREAKIYMKAEEYKDALIKLKEARKLEPNNVEIQKQIKICEEKLKQ